MVVSPNIHLLTNGWPWGSRLIPNIRSPPKRKAVDVDEFQAQLHKTSPWQRAPPPEFLDEIHRVVKPERLKVVLGKRENLYMVFLGVDVELEIFVSMYSLVYIHRYGR